MAWTGDLSSQVGNEESDKGDHADRSHRCSNGDARSHEQDGSDQVDIHAEMTRTGFAEAQDVQCSGRPDEDDARGDDEDGRGSERAPRRRSP